MQSTRYSCPISMKPEFSRRIFEKLSNIKFHENTSSGSRIVLCRRTGRHEEAFLQFCESALKENVASVNSVIYLLLTC